MSHNRPNFLCLAALLALVVAGGCDLVLSRSGGIIRTDQFIGREPPPTIQLMDYHGPTARADSERVRDELLSKGLGDAFVVAGDNEAFLCYGIYSDVTDKKLQKDKATIMRLVDAQGRRIFGRGFTVLLPEILPQSQWDLSTAKGRYTVMVATFDLYGRTTMAVNYAAELRQKGWEAYVFHGDTMSHVTIGSFGKEIFRGGLEQLYSKGNEGERIVSPAVKHILNTFPYLNWDGHVPTAQEVKQMNITISGDAFSPQEKKKVPVTQKGRFDSLVMSKVVAIPDSLRRLHPAAGPASPTPSPPPAPPPGPIPSPNAK
jgi:hypothetical protein